MTPLRMTCAVFVVLVACSRGSAQEAQLGRTSPAPADSRGVANTRPGTDVTSAVESVATALCDHVLACDTTHQPPFSSRAACLDEVRASLSHDLNASTCPGNLDEGQLRTCLTAVENQDCHQPLESPEPIDQCRASALCSKH